MNRTSRRSTLLLITGFLTAGAVALAACSPTKASSSASTKPSKVTLTGEHHVTGTVADVAFRGRGYEHAIDIPGHARLTSVFSDTRAERGELVGLRLDPRGCHLFSAGPEAPAVAGPASRTPVPAKP
jgi:iron(III) transport system ATP-binding protein